VSRIDDDNSDAQRIREMQEAQLRQKVQNEKRSDGARFQQAFQQAMNLKKGAEGQKEATQKESQEKATQTGRQALEQARKQGPQAQSELARRAALSRSLAQGMQTKRAQEGQEVRVHQEQRTDELVQKRSESAERVEREEREREVRDDLRTEEQQADKRQEAVGTPTAGVERREDGRSRGHGQKDDDKKASGVDGAKNTSGASGAGQIPPEVMQQIVGAIYQAVTADGRSELTVHLKGTLLEGVQLRIHAEKGKVSCEFVGCNTKLKSMLKSGKEALATGLAKRGLKLVALEAL